MDWTSSASEGVEDDGGVDEHGGGDEGDERHYGAQGGAAAPQRPQLDLDHVDEGQHQEPAPEHGADGGGDDPGAQERPVDARRPAVRAGEVDGLLEAEGHEAGEEEGSEGADMEGDEVLLHLRPGDAVGRWESFVAGAGAGGGGVPGEADEDGEG